MRSRVQATIGAVAMVVVFGAALWAIHRELAAHSWREISAAIGAIPRPRIALALAAAAASYLVLTCYEALALRILRRSVPYRVIAGTAFVANAIAHTIGLGDAQTLAAEEFAKKVAQKTGNAIQIDLYPASQLGNDPKNIEGVKLGTIDMGMTGNPFFTSFSPRSVNGHSRLTSARSDWSRIARMPAK